MIFSETMRNVIITKGEDGFFIANVPSLPGCVSQGKTYEEALKNITAALKLYIDALKEDGKTVPAENTMLFSLSEEALDITQKAYA